MANQEQLDILKQDVIAWNNWRRKHKSVKINLYQADLRRTDLERADLMEADLREADLRGAR